MKRTWILLAGFFVASALATPVTLAAAAFERVAEARQELATGVGRAMVRPGHRAGGPISENDVLGKLDALFARGKAGRG